MHPLAFLLLAIHVAATCGDDTEDLRRFLARYRTGAIDASVIGRLVPSEEPPPAFPAYERAREKMRRNPTIQGAEVLLEAAVLRLAADPEVELQRFAALQPWVIRRRAIDELGTWYTSDGLQEWALGLLDGPSLPVEKRRVLVEVLGAASRENPRPEVYARLLEALSDADGRVRGFAAAGLGPLLRSEDLRRVLVLLHDLDASVRLQAARALRAALPRVRDELGMKGLSWPIQIVATRLVDEDAHVRLALVELLKELPHEAAIPHLVDALEAEERRVGTPEARLRFRAGVEDLLRSLTGHEALLSSAGWRRWLARGDADRDEGDARRQTRTDGVRRAYPRWFEREVVSDHVVFVMDFSGSMRRRPGNEAYDRGEGKRDHGSRILLARREFARYLGALDETHYFNVVVFAVGSLAAFDELVPATAAAKERALSFVAQVPLGGATDLFAGIVRGLRCAGLDAGDRFATRADTVYVLSDGIPTAGAVTDPADIVRIITKMNESSGLAIHVVDLGARHETFQKHLQALAWQNGGEYIRP